MIQRSGVGLYALDLDAIKEKGIPLYVNQGVNAESVAEHALLLMLSCFRKLPTINRNTKAGIWKKQEQGVQTAELKGKTVGIIGYGKIGRRTAELFHAFGCSLLAHSRRIKEDAPDWVEQVSREALLQRSDIVVLHCPLNDSTRGMIDYAALKRMKPSAFLINVARGPVVAEKDLVRALEENLIAGAAADVFDTEPPLPQDTPILRAPRTLLTPHVAFATRESMSLRAGIVFENLRAWLSGDPKNLVL
jgi:D-3-phosphoglycerate dehydrogenase